MKAFTVPFRELQTVRELEAQRREEKTPVAVSGCTPAQKSHFFYAFCEEAECKLILTFSEQRAREIAEDMRFYNPGQTLYSLHIPQNTVLPFRHSGHTCQTGMQIRKTIPAYDSNAHRSGSHDPAFSRNPRMAAYVLYPAEIPHS